MADFPPFDGKIEQNLLKFLERYVIDSCKFKRCRSTDYLAVIYCLTYATSQSIELALIDPGRYPGRFPYKQVDIDSQVFLRGILVLLDKLEK